MGSLRRHADFTGHMAILLLNIKRLLKVTQMKNITHVCVARRTMDTDQLEIVNRKPMFVMQQ